MRPVLDRRFRGVSQAAMLAVLMQFALAQGALAQGDPLEAKGAVPQHGSLSFMPWERINTLGGNVLLSFNDFVLPGNAGFNLVVQRSYNSKDMNWTWGVGPQMFFPPPTLNTPTDFSDDPHPVILMPDGSEIPTVWTGQQGVYLTTSFHRVTHLDPDVHKLEMPNGVTCFYEGTGRLRRMEDPFGNRVFVEDDATYPSRIARVIQCLEGQTDAEQPGDKRIVEFEYNHPGEPLLQTAISCNGRRWEYVWEDVGTNVWELTEVHPPAGPSWVFTYPAWSAWDPNDQTTYVYNATLVTLPTGGTVKYTSRRDIFAELHGRDEFVTDRLCQRDTFPRNSSVPDSTWTFDYTTTEYYSTTLMRGVASSGNQPEQRLWHTHHMQGNGEFVYLSTIAQSRFENGQDVDIETTDITWEAGVTLGQAWVEPYPAWSPPNDTSALLPDQVTVTRDDRPYTRTYTYESANYNHFGSPSGIVETGDFSRAFDYTYRQFSAAYVADRVASQVTRDPGNPSAPTYTTEYGYDDLGFLTSKSVYGTTITYTPGDYGNVGSQIDANQHTTTFGYRWGAVSSVETPENTPPWRSTKTARRRRFGSAAKPRISATTASDARRA